ncbi:hypothetical protein NSU08_42695 [Paenibacillus sp. FSL H7-0331]|uniref:hypothetical protein n=1 Tax=Paenibacillus sp. FSL H7-0331 TaxID=1920421 RepID=UPI0030F579FE
MKNPSSKRHIKSCLPRLSPLDSLIDSISYLEIDKDEAASEGGMQISFNELKADPGRAGGIAC